jgi:hypothetical protein
MGKDYIAPPDLSAEAGFTVMNPQESVNNFLSNSISAANNSRTNFQSGINQAIAAANSARIAEQNRQNALTLQTQRAAAQADRLKIADQIKRKFEYEDINNFVNFKQDLLKSGMSPEQAEASTKALANTRLMYLDEGSPAYNLYSKYVGQTSQPQQPSNTELTPEDLAITGGATVDNTQPMQAGAVAQEYVPEPQAPSVDFLAQDREAQKIAQGALQAEQRAKIYDTDAKAVEAQGRLGIQEVKDKKIDEFADMYARNDVERSFIRSIKNDISLTAEGQKNWEKGRDSFNASEDNITDATQKTKQLIDVYKKMQARGLTISDSGTSMLRAVQGKALSNDSSSGTIYDEKIKAETLIPEDVELSRELYGVLSSLEPNFISINRALGNVGTQTENDFTRALKLVFSPGLTDPQSLIKNAEDGFGFLMASNVKNGVKYGNERAASNAMIELNNRNLVLNAAGRAIPGDPFRNQPISTQAPAVQQPSIVQQPVAQIAAPKPSSVSTSRGYKTYNVKPSSFEDELNYFNSL